MNAFTRFPIFLFLLAGAAVLLPACGGNGIKQNPNTTVLNPDQTPVLTPVSQGMTDLGSSGKNTSIGVYVEKIHRSKGPKSKTTITTTPVATTDNSATTAATPVTTPQQTPAVETALPVKKSGAFHWVLWLLVIIVLGVIGWYFWSRSRSHSDQSGQPTPPMGGLSPVSGYTAVKDRIEDEAEGKPSLWSKKIF